VTAAQIVFLLVIFAAVSAVTYFVMAYFAKPAGMQRLNAIAEDAYRGAPSPWRATRSWIGNLLARVAKLSVPQEKWENSPLRVRFMNAGFRGVAASAVYFAAKTSLTFVIPGLVAIYMAAGDLQLKGQTMLLVLLALAAIGYYLPNFVLARLIARRQGELFENLPDALDLMRICVEAGLGIDAAIARVGDELRMNSEALYDELHLVGLELRAGASRDRALRNLALRMGLEEADALVAMLVQAERFGTSVADSLRVHSDGLRVKRRFRAEENAAKVPVKLLFPLIFCMFPAFLVVLLGPAFISIYRIMFTTLAGQ
jgi:tight adherence protein C